MMEPHRAFLEALRAEKPDVTLSALCERLLTERGVNGSASRSKKTRDYPEFCVGAV
jgi:hypothetical protein